MTKKILISFITFSLFYLAACQRQAPLPASAEKSATSSPAICSYETDSKAITLEWTAFKFTEKTPVKGSFTTTTISGPTSASSLKDLAKGLKIDIDASSVESGNAGRNATVREYFFQKFSPPFKISAEGGEITGDDKQGELKIRLTMNGIAKELPFKYSVDEKSTLVATATMDMFDFGLKDAFDSIHQTCEQLHTGSDGVSKTWNTVDLKLSAPIVKKCP